MILKHLTKVVWTRCNVMSCSVTRARCRDSRSLSWRLRADCLRWQYGPLCAAIHQKLVRVANGWATAGSGVFYMNARTP